MSRYTRQRGFVDIEVIDDDLGRSASGTVARPGFDRLVAWLCVGKVGAVLCFDASKRVVRERFGIDLSEVSLGRVLKKLGFSRISARPQHPKQHPEAIAAFKKTSPPRWRRS